MIPKVIHYCWFGNGSKNDLFKKCYKSWKKYCPGYEIIEWNESNIDISSLPIYAQEAYELKKWAFVTDYVRLAIIYEQGGIYLDTDVELIKPIDHLLNYPAFFGFQKHLCQVNTGQGFGAEKGNAILQDLMADYEGIHFALKDGEFDITPCPERNLHVFKEHGLAENFERQTLDEGSIVLEPEVLSPIAWDTGEKKITKNTVAIHWYSASWKSEQKGLGNFVKKHLGYSSFYRFKSKKQRLSKLVKKIDKP